jgi:Skp family chaperone for outer membrane proteins
VYVGATVEARNRVVGVAGEVADRFGSPANVQRTVKRQRAEIEKDVRRFERKGTTTRNQLERDVRKARTRLERELRTRRRNAEQLIRRNARPFEREAKAAERQAARRRNVVTEGIATVSNRVEGVVQVGVATGERFASLAKDRVTSIA